MLVVENCFLVVDDVVVVLFLLFGVVVMVVAVDESEDVVATFGKVLLVIEVVHDVVPFWMDYEITKCNTQYGKLIKLIDYLKQSKTPNYQYNSCLYR